MPIYCYTRVSTSMQADEGESLALQQRQIEGWALMHGHTLAGSFEERGVSGSIPVAERPEGRRLWDRLDRGDMIVAAKLDRLFRSALDALQTVKELKTRGISLVLLDLGNEDVSSNGLSKVFLTIAAAFAEAERDRIRERVSQTKADQRSRGRYLGGKVPFGYRVEDGGLVGVPEEQAMITTAKALRSDAKSLRTIQATLAAQHGRKLSLDALSRILNEPEKVAT